MTVSVIVPVYNTEKYLHTCVESLLGQTYPDLEIILVDDGSPDGSPFICDEYVNKDLRIKVIHKENGGLSSARNAALDIATGEYVSFVDSDDYLHPDAIAKAVDVLLKTGADACMFSHYVLNECCCTPVKLPLEKELYLEEEVHSEILPKFFGKTKSDAELEGFVCRQVFKREAIGNLRFKSEREYFAEDIVFDIEIYSKVKSFAVVNEPLYFYRYVESSLSNRYRKNLFEKLARLLDFMTSYATENVIEDVEDRILNTSFRFARYGIRNVKISEDLTYVEKLQAVKNIADNPHVANALKMKRESLKEKAFAFLLRHKMARIILALI